MILTPEENATTLWGVVMRVQERLTPALSRVLLLLTISVIVNYVDRANLSTAAPLLKDELSLTASQLGILLSSFFWAYAAFMVLAGWLADRYDASWVLAAGFTIWCLATVGTGFVQGFVTLIIARLMLGMGESVSWPCYCSLVARNFPEDRRGVANSAIAIGIGIGPAVGMFTGGIMMARLGWRVAFITVGILGLFWLPTWLKWKPKASSATAPQAEFSPGFPDILRQYTAWGTFLGSFSQCYLWYLLLTWMPFYLVRGRHFSMDNMAKIMGAAYLFTTVSSMLSGWISDRWIASGGNPTLVRKTFVGVGQTCAGLCLLFCSNAGPVFLVVLLLSSFAFYGLYVAQLWAVSETLAGPQASGRWMGVQNFFGSLAGIAAPWITGILVNRTGSFYWPFAITAALAVVGTLVWVFMVGTVKQVAWTRREDTELTREFLKSA